MNIKETGFILFLENYEANGPFYTDVLGLTIREKQDGLMKLNFGGSYLMVEKNGVASSSEKTRAQNPTVLRLEVEDLDEAIGELRSRGAAVEVLCFDWGTIGVIIDPEGNRIELKGYVA